MAVLALVFFSVSVAPARLTAALATLDRSGDVHMDKKVRATWYEQYKIPLPQAELPLNHRHEEAPLSAEAPKAELREISVGREGNTGSDKDLVTADEEGSEASAPASPAAATEPHHGNTGTVFPDKCQKGSRFCEFYAISIDQHTGTKSAPFPWSTGVGEFAECGTSSCGDTTCSFVLMEDAIRQFLNSTHTFKVVSTKHSCDDCKDDMKPTCREYQDWSDNGPTYPQAPPTVSCTTGVTKACLLHDGGFPASACVPADHVCCGSDQASQVYCGASAMNSCDAQSKCKFSTLGGFLLANGEFPELLNRVSWEPSPPPAPPLSPITIGDTSCFAARTTTACRIAYEPAHATDVDAAFADCYEGTSASSARAAASRVLLAELQADDWVLTRSRDGKLRATRVLVNQHAAAEHTAPMLTLDTTDGASLTLTADHAIFADGALVAAGAVAPGAQLIDGLGRSRRVARVTAAAAAAVINPVTDAGTILVSERDGAPLLAACHPIWIAPLATQSMVVRAIVNVLAVLAGERVHSPVEGALVLLGQLALTATFVGGSMQLLRRSRK